MTYSIRLQLLDYKSTYGIVKVLNTYWRTYIPRDLLVKYFLDACEYGALMVDRGECSEYNVIYGED